MTAAILPFIRPRETAEQRAWKHYCALVRAQQTNRALIDDFRHQQLIVAAWHNWRALYLSLPAARAL